MRASIFRLTALIMLCAVLAMVASCSKTVWTKPGADAQDFDRDKVACLAQSYQSAPVSNTSVPLGGGYTQPAYTNCYGVGYGINCTTTGGAYIPPPTVTIDQNTGARNAVFNACMYSLGWTLTRVDNSPRPSHMLDETSPVIPDPVATCHFREGPDQELTLSACSAKSGWVR